MEELLDSSKKKTLFYIYNFPLTFFLVLLLTFIAQTILAFFVCTLFADGHIEYRISGVTLAICGESIPTFVAILPIFILFAIGIAIWILVRKYRKLQYLQISKKAYMYKMIIGILMWLIFAFQLSIIISILWDFRG